MSTTFEPEVYGKYYLVDKIATGGMAEIFKAKTYSHGGFQNYLVIKRILAHLSENDDFVSMFIDEAKVSVALQHPNIVRIYDFGKLDENYYIAMECVEGKDLRNVLRKLAKQRRYVPIEFVVLVAHEVCKGLAYAHAKSDLQGNPQGIVHRDISPSNVLISYDGEIKIADFGIAKAESNAYATDAGVLKGKFEYMSPEQARGEAIDHRSDVFSLGIILHETLTGRRLFKRDSDVSTLNAIKEEGITPPAQINGRVPRPLDRIVMRALATDPADRYGSADEMQQDLLDLMLPETPDTLRPRLARFLAEVFADEIAEERARLEHGSRIADQLHKDAPSGWDGATQSTLRTPARSTRPWLVSGALMLLATLGVLAAIALMVAVPALLRDEPPAAPPAPATPVATTGAIDVLVLPTARLLLDGVELSPGAETFAAEDVPAGPHVLRFEADGYEPAEERVDVVAGARVTVRRTLAQQAAAKRSTPPEPAGEPAAVRFTSSPSGATVYVDGEEIGVAPLTWRRARAGRRYRVEYRIDGFESRSGEISGLEAGETRDFELALSRAGREAPAAPSPGTLTVALVGGGWAEVTVDGRKLDKPAPLRDVPIAAGSHRIRVQNADLGIDHTETVSVAPGGEVTVRARPR